MKLQNVKRVIFDLFVLFTIGLIIFLLPYSLLPIEAKGGIITLFVTKFLFVSAGVLHAHVSRKLLFPYIDFSKNQRLGKDLLIIAWYIVIIWSWARGG